MKVIHGQLYHCGRGARLSVTFVFDAQVKLPVGFLISVMNSIRLAATLSPEKRLVLLLFTNIAVGYERMLNCLQTVE